MAAPGLPSKLNIVVGIVGRCGLTKKAVAPNSPIAIANENDAPAIRDLEIIGKSTWRHTFLSDAPRTFAASRISGLMSRNAVPTIRATNPTPRTACAIGMIHQLDLMSQNELFNVTMIPKPSSTPDVPNGSRKSTSAGLLIFVEGVDSRIAAKYPRKVAMAIARSAQVIELIIAVRVSNILNRPDWLSVNIS